VGAAISARAKYPAAAKLYMNLLPRRDLGVSRCANTVSKIDAVVEVSVVAPSPFR